MKNIAGHTFLAKLGKKRLRPGGIKATRFLMKHANLTKETKILEVGCNRGYSTIELLKKYKFIKMIAVDIDEEALKIAEENAIKAKVSDRIEFIKADATALHFEDNSFDIIINEAMLTMLPKAKKEQAVKGYFRILKKGGKLLTHDMMIDTADENLYKQIIADLSREIMVHVQPLTLAGWHDFFASCGFLEQERLTGKMSLLNPVGIIKDEGLFNTIKIVRNALKKENKPRFVGMSGVFKKYQANLRFIANVSYKL